MLKEIAVACMLYSRLLNVLPASEAPRPPRPARLAPRSAIALQPYFIAALASRSVRDAGAGAGARARCSKPSR